MNQHQLRTRVTLGGQLIFLAVGLALLSPAARSEDKEERRGGGKSGLRGTMHDLSVTGGGTIRSEESSVCLFCHASHTTSREAPLWNRLSSGATYTPYRSTTAKARTGQPTGSSRLCLSCHDGTMALGMVRSRQGRINFPSGIVSLPKGRSNLGTDLGDDHPVSFTYDTDLARHRGGELVNPDSLTDAVKLDHKGQMQCTTCHDAHDNRFGGFLVADNKASVLCTTCHTKQSWAGSVHRTSDAAWNGKGHDPWPDSTQRTVAGNACGSCHTPHGAEGRQRLLLSAAEEENCYPCHNGNVATKNIEAAFRRASAHPVTASAGIHDPTEDLVNSRRHVECADCHDSHAVNAAPATAPLASGALAGVPGISAAGTTVNPVRHEYELCFRCHGDSREKGPARVKRNARETNTRREFDGSGASYHPVVVAGRSDSVPSLIDPLTTSSMIYCSDCHSGSDSERVGGKGPRGPHGSKWSPILERRLDYKDYSSESPARYAMCYKCHSRESILADESFPEHRKHVVDAKVSCTTCHDSHGVRQTTHLINFNTEYVSTNGVGSLEFDDTGSVSGSCSLSCHGRDHENESY